MCLFLLETISVNYRTSENKVNLYYQAEKHFLTCSFKSKMLRTVIADFRPFRLNKTNGRLRQVLTPAIINLLTNRAIIYIVVMTTIFYHT
jgi:hypothetical protein